MEQTKTHLHHLTKEFKTMLEEGLIDSKGYFTEKHFEINGKDVVLDTVKEEVKQEATVPLSVVEKMIADALSKNAQPKTEEKRTINAPITDVDDIPEFRNWQMKDRQYILCDGLKPISFNIANRSTEDRTLMYTDVENQTVRALRYSTNQISLFVDKQTKELGSVAMSYIEFKNGMLKVPANNISLQKYLAITPDLNVVFKEFDPLEEDAKYIKNKKLGVKASALVFETGIIENRMIASLVCPSYVEDWSEEAIERELSLYAEKSPQLYIDMANDPSLKIKGIAKASVFKGLLIYDNILYRWLNKDRKVLVEVSKNVNEYDAIVSYFATDEGRVFLDYLRNS